MIRRLTSDWFAYGVCAVSLAVAGAHLALWLSR